MENRTDRFSEDKSSPYFVAKDKRPPSDFKQELDVSSTPEIKVLHTKTEGPRYLFSDSFVMHCAELNETDIPSIVVGYSSRDRSIEIASFDKWLEALARDPKMGSIEAVAKEVAKKVSDLVEGDAFCVIGFSPRSSGGGMCGVATSRSVFFSDEYYVPVIDEGLRAECLNFFRSIRR